MTKSACAMAMLISAVLAAGPVAAQEKKAEKKAPVRAMKILVDNDKVRVTEAVFKPGEENPMEPRGYRIGREKIEWKEGQVYQSGPDNASAKNIGKGEVVLYTVTVKQAK